jgi:DNA-binding response OmpR family regulator
VCRALRAESDPDFRNVPVVLLTAQTGAEDTAAGFAAGVTDYVTKPFSPAHIRARVHAWLRRKRAGAEGT